MDTSIDLSNFTMDYTSEAVTKQNVNIWIRSAIDKVKEVLLTFLTKLSQFMDRIHKIARNKELTIRKITYDYYQINLNYAIKIFNTIIKNNIMVNSKLFNTVVPLMQSGEVLEAEKYADKIVNDYQSIYDSLEHQCTALKECIELPEKYKLNTSKLILINTNNVFRNISKLKDNVIELQKPLTKLNKIVNGPYRAIVDPTNIILKGTLLASNVLAIELSFYKKILSYAA